MKYLIKKQDKVHGQFFMQLRVRFDDKMYKQMNEQLYGKLYMQLQEQLDMRFRRFNIPLYQPFGLQLCPKVAIACK